MKRSACDEGKQRYLYFVICCGRVNVGLAKNVQKRVSSLQIGNPDEIHLYGYIKGTAADEKRLHAEMREHRTRGEWFRWNAITKGIVDFEVANEIRNRNRGNAGETYNLHDYRDVIRLNKRLEKDILSNIRPFASDSQDPTPSEGDTLSS